jgi:hypothetical protein
MSNKIITPPGPAMNRSTISNTKPNTPINQNNQKNSMPQSSTRLALDSAFRNRNK